MRTGIFAEWSAAVAVEDGSQRMLSQAENALWAQGNLRNSRMWFDAAYHAGYVEGDRAAMARAAIGLGGIWVHEYRHAPVAALFQARLRRSLQQVSPESTLALRIRARLAAEADYRVGEHTAITAVLEKAMASGDHATRAEALSLAHHCLLGPGHSRLRQQLAQDLMAEGMFTKRRSDLLMGLLWYCVDLLAEADPHAPRRLAELRGLLADKEHQAIRYVVQAIDVMHRIRAGQLEEAEAQADVCVKLGQAVGDADAIGRHGAQIAAIRWYQGRIAELEPMFGRLAESPSLSTADHSWPAVHAVAKAASGDTAGAAILLGRLARNRFTHVPRSSSWLVTMHGVVETAALIGDRPTASAAYELLHPFAKLPILAGLGVACFGSVHHALGVAALTLGVIDTAIGHFRAAVGDNLALGHLPATVMSRRRLAQALRLRAGAGDSADAAAELAAANVGGVPITITDPGIEPGAVAACRRQGRHWAVELGDRQVVIEPSVGIAYLAILFANPSREIAAIDLVAGRGGRSTESAPTHQAVLDPAAMKAYRLRLVELRQNLATYDTAGDARASAAAHAEITWLAAELRGASGLGGRARAFNTEQERARISVSKAIRRAIDRIAEADAEIGERLRQTIQTGQRCCYLP